MRGGREPGGAEKNREGPVAVDRLPAFAHIKRRVKDDEFVAKLEVRGLRFGDGARPEGAASALLLGPLRLACAEQEARSEGKAGAEARRPGGKAAERIRRG